MVSYDFISKSSAGFLRVLICLINLSLSFFLSFFLFFDVQAFDDKRTLANILVQLSVMALAESNWGQATSLLLEAQVRVV